ncbi:hypothetical protein NFI96_021700, partial [Prochilodus magdalenae]
DAAPQDVAPQDAAPQDVAPQDAAPQDSAPQDAAPQDAAPQDAAPQDSAPQDAAPQDAAPQDSAPQDSAPQDAAPQDAAPQDTAPQDAAPQDAAPQDSAPQDSAPQDSAPQDAAPQDAVGWIVLELGVFGFRVDFRTNLKCTLTGELSVTSKPHHETKTTPNNRSAGPHLCEASDRMFSDVATELRVSQSVVSRLQQRYRDAGRVTERSFGRSHAYGGFTVNRMMNATPLQLPTLSRQTPTKLSDPETWRDHLISRPSSNGADVPAVVQFQSSVYAKHSIKESSARSRGTTAGGEGLTAPVHV